jgi:hypothetical protein
LFVAALPARTITVTAEDADEMASISSAAPRLSWVGNPPRDTGIFGYDATYYWESRMTLLMRFPLKDLIPKGQRVTKAELTIAPTYIAGTPEIHVRRILTEWGTGVCHHYRMTYPDKLAWAQAGCRGNATDRANKDSAVFKFAKVGPQTVDLTEDVELWYTGGAANRGWVFTMDTEGTHAYLPSPNYPLAAGAKQWKLQITFEPQ